MQAEADEVAKARSEAHAKAAKEAAKNAARAAAEEEKAWQLADSKTDREAKYAQIMSEVGENAGSSQFDDLKVERID